MLYVVLLKATQIAKIGGELVCWKTDVHSEKKLLQKQVPAIVLSSKLRLIGSRPLFLMFRSSQAIEPGNICDTLKEHICNIEFFFASCRIDQWPALSLLCSGY